MFGKKLGKHVDTVVAASQSGDTPRYWAGLEGITRSAAKATPAERQDAVTRLAPVVRDAGHGVGGDLAATVGDLVGFDLDPAPVLEILVFRATLALTCAVRFEGLHGAAVGGPAPDPSDEAGIRSAVDRFVTAATTPDLPAEEARELAEAWFTANDWVRPVLYLSQRKDVRAALPDREALAEAVTAATELVDTASWLHGLLQVVDDEPLLVVDRASGRAFRATISGLGDNFQLHTLLAAALPAEVLPGDAPSAAEVAAASTGDPTPRAPIRGNVNLVDAFGEWIWNEGRPADIPHLDGIRVAVIDPQPYPRTWNIGRQYPLMVPAVQIDAELPPAVAALLHARVKPSNR